MHHRQPQLGNCAGPIAQPGPDGSATSGSGVADRQLRAVYQEQRRPRDANDAAADDGHATVSRPARRCPVCLLLREPVPLSTLAAADLEGDDDLRDAAEQGEEPDPQQQERSAGGERLLRGPEAQDELQDADRATRRY